MKPPPHKSRVKLIVAAMIASISLAWACGPSFPSWLLNGGAGIPLVSPMANFVREMVRLKPQSRASLKAVPPAKEITHQQQTVDADLAELSEALARGQVAVAAPEKILASYAMARRRLTTPESLEAFEIPSGLPPEFQEYFRGSISFHLGDTNEARRVWSQLLKRPPAERHYRSTWTAFMLGKLDVDSAPDAAIEQFQAVRDLAAKGFADRIGLAASSLGWEARAWLNKRDYRQAIDLYLKHLASGDESSAVDSLRVVAAKACREGTATLRALAMDRQSRLVLSSYLVSNHAGFRREDQTQPADEWLSIIEQLGINDVELAEPLALAAYQNARFEIAQRWLDRASRDSVAANWLRAKLLLRSGKVDAASELLARIARSFPAQSEGSKTNSSSNFAASLGVFDESSWEFDAGSRRVLGELGVIRLSRREFVEALDALLRGGYWMDAAYVAERVLTLAELKRYVDRVWPNLGENPQPSQRDPWGAETTSAAQGNAIRYLLARRLARGTQPEEASAYYPPELQKVHQQLLAFLARGRDPHIPNDQRATALWEAALLTRFQGIELRGTEVEPDWFVHGGSFEQGVYLAQREERLESIFERATDEEIRRAHSHGVQPEKRWHYRYVAADLAWTAAQLMPDNDDDTARVLCRAGAWLKDRDPQAADRFYKALVRRCRRTEIGRVADRLRWFPVLDDAGKIVPPKPRPPAESFEIFE